MTGLQMFNLGKAAAAEFLEVYKGVVAPGEFRCVARHSCLPHKQQVKTSTHRTELLVRSIAYLDKCGTGTFRSLGKVQ